MSKIIRITDDSYDKLDKLATETGASKQLLIDQAIEGLIRKNFFKRADRAYEALKKNPKEWQEELQERAEWESFNDNPEDN